MAVQHWTIQTDGDDVEIRLGSRRKKIVPSEVDAIRWISKHREDHQKVFVIEHDGYRLDITRRHFSR